MVWRFLGMSISYYIKNDWKDNFKKTLSKITSGQDRVTGTGFSFQLEAMTITTIRQECMKQLFSRQSDNEQSDNGQWIR